MKKILLSFAIIAALASCQKEKVTVPGANCGIITKVDQPNDARFFKAKATIKFNDGTMQTIELSAPHVGQTYCK